MRPSRSARYRAACHWRDLLDELELAGYEPVLCELLAYDAKVRKARFSVNIMPAGLRARRELCPRRNRDLLDLIEREWQRLAPILVS